MPNCRQPSGQFERTRELGQPSERDPDGSGRNQVEAGRDLPDVHAGHDAIDLASVLNQVGSMEQALADHTKLSSREIAEEAMKIASRMCIYTNDKITIEEL